MCPIIFPLTSPKANKDQKMSFSVRTATLERHKNKSLTTSFPSWSRPSIPRGHRWADGNLPQKKQPLHQ